MGIVNSQHFYGLLLPSLRLMGDRIRVYVTIQGLCPGVQWGFECLACWLQG